MTASDARLKCLPPKERQIFKEIVENIEFACEINKDDSYEHPVAFNRKISKTLRLNGFKVIKNKKIIWYDNGKRSTAKKPE